MSATRYTSEMRAQFKMTAVWPPNTPVRVGAVGIIEDGHRFTYQTTLELLEIPYEADPPGPSANYEHSTEGSVELRFKAAGQVPQPTSALSEGEAGVTVRFKRENSVYFKADDAVVHRIKDQKTLGEQLMSAYHEDRWDKQYVVVVEVVAAKSATVLISSGAGAEVELGAKAAIAAGTFSLANGDLGLSIKRSRKVATKIVAEQAITPLVRVLRIRKEFLRKARVAFEASSNEEYTEEWLPSLEPADDLQATVTNDVRVDAEES